MAVDTVGVLDTSTLVLLERLDAEEPPAEPVITAVTLAELSVGPLVAPDDGERVARQLRLQQAEATATATGLPVSTCNPRDFEGIDGLRLRGIPHPDRAG